jgi:hypothetical protein
VSREEKCNICGFSKGEHVATEDGPLTCPRVARGEGRYVKVREAHTQGGFWPGEEYEVPALYEFRHVAQAAPHRHRRPSAQGDGRG